MPEIETLFPLLLQSLDLQDPDVRAATIENLMIVSQENPEAVEGHISSLVSRLLKATAETKVNAPVCDRISHEMGLFSALTTILEGTPQRTPVPTNLSWKSQGQRSFAL